MRISRRMMFMQMAKAAALRSTCFRLNVGCVIVQDKNVVGIGYNGAPSGIPHCTGNGCAHYRHTGCGVVHAEVNALERAPKDWDELYVTHSPCRACAAHIIAASITKPRTVIYEVEYRDKSPVEWLTQQGVKVYRLLPSGYVVDVRTNELVGL